jgi:hypothetical protein
MPRFSHSAVRSIVHGVVLSFVKRDETKNAIFASVECQDEENRHQIWSRKIAAASSPVDILWRY